MNTVGQNNGIIEITDNEIEMNAEQQMQHEEYDRVMEQAHLVNLLHKRLNQQKRAFRKGE